MNGRRSHSLFPYIALPIAIALGPLFCAAADDPALTITVRERIALAPSSVHAKIVIERDARNRALTITIDGDRFFQSGERQVDGDQSQRVWDLWWHEVPCGDYDVRAELTRVEQGRRTTERARGRVTLYGTEPNCPDHDNAHFEQ